MTLQSTNGRPEAAAAVAPPPPHFIGAHFNVTHRSLFLFVSFLCFSLPVVCRAPSCTNPNNLGKSHHLVRQVTKTFFLH